MNERKKASNEEFPKVEDKQGVFLKHNIKKNLRMSQTLKKIKDC